MKYSLILILTFFSFPVSAQQKNVRITDLGGVISAIPTRDFYGTLGYSNQSQNRVAAAPASGVGPLTVRLLVAGDIPVLDATKITTGTLPVARGGTGLTAVGSSLQLIRTNVGGTALEYFSLTGAIVSVGTYGYQNVKLNNTTNLLDRYNGEYVDFVTLSTSSTNASTAEYYINTDNTARTVVIPVATGDNQGRRYTIVNSANDTGGTPIVQNITIDATTNSIRINGATGNLTVLPGASLTIISNGIQWYRQ